MLDEWDVWGVGNIILTMQEVASKAVDVACIRSQEALSGMSEVISTQDAVEGIKGAVARIHEMSQQMAAASEKQASVAEEISRQITSIAHVFYQNADIAHDSSIVGDNL